MSAFGQLAILAKPSCQFSPITSDRIAKKNGASFAYALAFGIHGPLLHFHATPCPFTHTGLGSSRATVGEVYAHSYVPMSRFCFHGWTAQQPIFS